MDLVKLGLKSQGEQGVVTFARTCTTCGGRKGERKTSWKKHKQSELPPLTCPAGPTEGAPRAEMH